MAGSLLDRFFMDTFVPKLLSIILLLFSVALLWPLGSAVLAIASGSPVPPRHWLYPLLILGTGAIMTWMLTRKTIPMRLYVVAFALWVVTAGYFFSLSVR